MSLNRRSATQGAKGRQALSPASRRADIADAAETLRRATAFLGSGPGIAAGEHARRVTGNGLREIDRFFCLLLDAIGGEGLAGQHNCANKVGHVLALLGAQADYARHLRSVGRVRDCLAYTDGTVRRGDDRFATLLTMSWPDSGTRICEREVRIGDALGLTARELSEICRFYDNIANDLVLRAYKSSARA
jgi:hypothetical protein